VCSAGISFEINAVLRRICRGAPAVALRPLELLISKDLLGSNSQAASKCSVEWCVIWGAMLPQVRLKGGVNLKEILDDHS
jgi:hypothetical protein